MLDPMEVMEVMKKQSVAPAPLPTVLPDDITYQKAGHVGTQTLW